MQCACSVSRLLASNAASTSIQHALRRRALHATRSWNAISNFAMPAMSPTMTEGGIAQWKLKEGEAFSAGDVLLEVETDKATIDVEAQDDGILGKILAPDGSKSIPIGKVIALLAEEGDDISNLGALEEEQSKVLHTPREEPKPQPSKTSELTLRELTPQPVSHEIHIQHSKPLFPSVYRLLVENGVEKADVIKGTGVRGMLTKGDVLAFLGKASSPWGTYKPLKTDDPEIKKVNEESKPLDGQAVRQLIITSLLQSSLRARPLPPPVSPYDFDSIITDYLPSNASPSPPNVAPPKQSASSESYFDGLL